MTTVFQLCCFWLKAWHYIWLSCFLPPWSSFLVTAQHHAPCQQTAEQTRSTVSMLRAIGKGMSAFWDILLLSSWTWHCPEFSAHPLFSFQRQSCRRNHITNHFPAILSRISDCMHNCGIKVLSCSSYTFPSLLNPQTAFAQDTQVGTRKGEEKKQKREERENIKLLF